MDLNNIIEPKPNMEELVSDYISWCLLSHKQRKISNGECYAKYGCNVPELYNRYKEALKNAQDQIDKEPDNLKTVMENYDIEADKDDLITISRNLSMSPFVVIIDPSMRNMEELNSAINSFFTLSRKHRIISNDYSWQLWGYSVPEMYNKMVSSIISGDDSNIITDNSQMEFKGIVKESFDAQSKDSLDNIYPVINMYNHALLENNLVNRVRFSEAIESMKKESSDYTNLIESINENFKKYIKRMHEVSGIETLNTVPWFSDQEYKKYNDKSFTVEHEGYYKKIKTLVEDYQKDPTKENADKVLEMGWNPNVKVNATTIETAKSRLSTLLSKELTEVYDISNLNEISVENPEPVPNLVPIYFLFVHEKPELDGMIPKFYAYVGISFNNKFYYTFKKDNFNKGFEVHRFSDFEYGTIVLAYLEPKIANQMERVFSKATGEEFNVDTNNIFEFLTKSITNQYDPVNKRFVYSSIILQFMNVANICADKYQIEHPWMDSDINQLITNNEHMIVYEIYSGYLNQTDAIEQSIGEKIEVITKNLYTALDKLSSSSSIPRFNSLRPHSIYNIK